MATSFSVNNRIKKILCDIIDVAYSDESEYMRTKYKDFTVEVTDNSLLSRNGSYDPKTAHFSVCNLQRGSGDIVKTCLHELSHHVDFVKNGRTGHQKPFYLAYRRLIYASLDMGITKKSDFDTVGSSDSNKVFKMVEEYTPRPVKYESGDKKLLKVSRAYDIKEQLKEKGFKYNNLEQTWEKPYSENDRAFLDDLSATYSITSEDMYVNAVVRIVAKGKTFDVKDVLRSHGFYYKDKKWQKKVRSDELDGELKALKRDVALNGLMFTTSD